MVCSERGRWLFMVGKSKTQSRKSEHVDICLRKQVESQQSTGFEDVDFLHNALPELDFEKIDLSCTMFGKDLKAPLVINAMTGGYDGAEKINKTLAQAAQESGIALGLGSQRAMLESPKLAKTYSVRDVAPDIMLIGNLGVAQLKKYSNKKIKEMLFAIEADAVAFHLNSLQECVQPEGNKNFEGCLKLIELASDEIPLPIIVKETGAGITREVAKSLQNAGVMAIDVSGLGGTSWSAVENYRNAKVNSFDNWGIPTAHCVAEVSKSVTIPIISSGGIRNGLDIAKSIALGASFAGSALPFLKAACAGNSEKLKAMLQEWELELKTAMFLTGSKNIEALKTAKVIITGLTGDSLRARGVRPEEFAQR